MAASSDTGEHIVQDCRLNWPRIHQIERGSFVALKTDNESDSDESAAGVGIGRFGPREHACIRGYHSRLNAAAGRATGSSQVRGGLILVKEIGLRRATHVCFHGAAHRRLGPPFLTCFGRWNLLMINGGIDPSRQRIAGNASHVDSRCQADFD